MAPPVAEVESWVSLGRRYYSGMCRTCNDWEWSARWADRMEAATERMDHEAQRALEHQRTARVAKGRTFFGQARCG